MKLSPAMRLALEELKSAAAREDWENAEIACCGIECWLGNRRTSWSTVNALLRLVAISDNNDNGSVRRYSINETGRAILADESQIEPLIAALRLGGAWEWKDGKLVRMNK